MRLKTNSQVEDGYPPPFSLGEICLGSLLHGKTASETLIIKGFTP